MTLLHYHAGFQLISYQQNFVIRCYKVSGILIDISVSQV